MHHKSEPYRIFLAANRRVWKAIRAGDYRAAERWSALADRQHAIDTRSNTAQTQRDRSRVWIEERKVRIAHLKKWGK